MTKQYDHTKIKPLRPKPNLNEGEVSVARNNDGTLTINVNGRMINVADPSAVNKLKSEMARMRDEISNLKQAVRLLSKK